MGLLYLVCFLSSLKSEVAELTTTDRCGHPVAFTTPALSMSTSRMNNLLAAISTGVGHIFVEVHVSRRFLC